MLCSEGGLTGNGTARIDDVEFGLSSEGEMEDEGDIIDLLTLPATVGVTNNGAGIRKLG